MLVRLEETVIEMKSGIPRRRGFLIFIEPRDCDFAGKSTESNDMGVT